MNDGAYEMVPDEFAIFADGFVMEGSAFRRPKVGIDNYQSDPLFPRIARVVSDLLQHGKVVTPVDVLIGMRLLTPERVEDWRRGRLPYLERVINCNLTRLSRLLRILRFHAHDLNLRPSWTAYMRWGKGSKQRLRFTKTGEPKLEKVYATHLIWPGKGPFHLPRPRSAAGPREARCRNSLEDEVLPLE